MAYTPPGSSPGIEGADRLREAQLALRRLATALKASQLYSFQHRNTMEPIDRFLETVDNYIEQHGPLVFEIRRSSFVLDFEDQAREDAAITPLVFSLDARGVKRLSFSRGVNADDIQHLLTVLTMALGSVQAAGGIAPLFRDRRVEHITFQETAVIASRTDAPATPPIRAIDHPAESARPRDDLPPAPSDPDQAAQLLHTLLAADPKSKSTAQDQAQRAYDGLRRAERAIINALPPDRPALYQTLAQAITASRGPEADALRALIARRASEDPLAAALARDGHAPAPARATGGTDEALPVETAVPAVPDQSDLTDVDEAGVRLEGVRALSSLLRITRTEAAEPLTAAIEREMAYLPLDRDLGQLARLFVELHEALRRHESPTRQAFLQQLLPRELMMRFVDPASAVDRAAAPAVEEFWDALRADLLPVLFETLATDERSNVRKAICRTAARMGRADLSAVTARLGDPDWRMVRAAIDVLEEIHDPGTLRQIGRLLQHSDLRVRREAIRVLAAWGAPEATALVSTALLESDVETRRAVAAQLGVVGTPEAEALLISALSEHEFLPHEFAVHLEIIVALGQIGTAEALPVIEPFVKTSVPLVSPKQRTLRRAAEEAMREIQTRGRRTGPSPVS